MRRRRLSVRPCRAPMRDAAPADAVGYLAVHLPELRVWQGFFVRPASLARGEALLVEARSTGSAVTGASLPGASESDNAAIGSLSATIAKLLSLAVADPPPPRDRAAAIKTAIGDLAHALHLAAGAPWLLVTGWRAAGDPRGMETRVQPVDAASLDEARAAIAGEIERAAAAEDPIRDFTDLVSGRVRRGPVGSRS